MKNNTGNFLASNINHAISLDLPEDSGRRNVYLLTFGAIAVVYLLQSLYASSKTFKAPFVGFRSKWEPRFVVGLRFSNGALSQVTEGYQKVCQQNTYAPETVSDSLAVQSRCSREWHV
jgi:hypothetical protein